MRGTAVLAFAMLLAGPAFAQPQMHAEDHLEPDSSILGGGIMASYDSMLRDVFHTAYEPDVTLRMIALPSFVPEYAVGLRRANPYGQGGSFRIFGLTPAVSIWTYQSIEWSRRGAAIAPDAASKALTLKDAEKLQASVPANIHDVKIAQCEADIDAALGNRIAEVWRKMLLRTRYSAQFTAGADGATYNFSMIVRGLGPASGKVWLPDRTSSTGTLVTLANEMYGICSKRKNASVERLENLTAELERRLQ